MVARREEARVKRLETYSHIRVNWFPWLVGAEAREAVEGEGRRGGGAKGNTYD